MAVLQRHAGVAGFPWPPKRGGLKRALRSPGRYAAGRCRLCSSRARRSPREGSGCQGGTQGAAMGRARARALTQERAQRTLAALSSRKNRSGQMQARAAPAPARPRRLPGQWEAFHRGPPRSTEPDKRPMPASREERTPLPAWTRPSSGPPDRRKRLCAAPAAGAQLRHPPRRRVTIAGLLSFRHSRLASALV